MYSLIKFYLSHFLLSFILSFLHRLFNENICSDLYENWYIFKKNVHILKWYRCIICSLHCYKSKTKSFSIIIFVFSTQNMIYEIDSLIRCIDDSNILELNGYFLLFSFFHLYSKHSKIKYR